MKFLKFWFPVVLYSAIIFCVSSIPNLQTQVRWYFFDELLHLFEYAVLGFLFARALDNSATKSIISKNKIIYITALFCFLYGLSDEFHQMFIVGREAGLTDVIADSIGGLLGGMVYKK